MVWAQDDQDLRWGGVVGWGGRGSRGLKKLKLAGLDGLLGVRRGRSQRCPLASNLGERALLQGKHPNGNSGEKRV